MASTLLSRSNNTEAITELQEFLAAYNFTTEEPDGKYGPRTKEAVKKFQQENEIQADGEVGPQTLNSIIEYGQNTPLPGSQSKEQPAPPAPPKASVEEPTSAPAATTPTQDPELSKPTQQRTIDKPVQTTATPDDSSQMDPLLDPRRSKEDQRTANRWQSYASRPKPVARPVQTPPKPTPEPAPKPVQQAQTAGNYQKFAQPAKKSTTPASVSTDPATNTIAPAEPAAFDHGMSAKPKARPVAEPASDAMARPDFTGKERNIPQDKPVSTDPATNTIAPQNWTVSTTADNLVQWFNDYKPVQKADNVAVDTVMSFVKRLQQIQNPPFNEQRPEPPQGLRLDQNQMLPQEQQVILEGSEASSQSTSRTINSPSASSVGSNRSEISFDSLS